MTTEAILDYLKRENRPYSINDIITNLKIESQKQAVQKSLDKLVTKKEIFEKVYGKQKIYCALQNSEHDTEELMRINRELQSHANEVETRRNEVEKSIREHEKKLATLRQNLSLEDAINAKEELKKRVELLSNKLDDLMESNKTEDLVIEKRKLEQTMKDYSREYNKRKRLCTEIIDCIMEGYPGSKKQLQEEIGIEIKIVP